MSQGGKKNVETGGFSVEITTNDKDSGNVIQIGDKNDVIYENG